MANKLVFVTVGTTEFDSLIKTILQNHCLQLLKDKGYTSLTLQIGKGKWEPFVNASSDSVNVIHYRYKTSLRDDINAADLVISHAGAGTCLEVLELGKALIVVINENLMDNHQRELAHALNNRGYAVATNLDGLLETIKNFDSTTLVPYPGADPSIFPSFLDKLMNKTL